MTNYVFVYYNGANPASQDPASEEQMEEIKKAWGAWFGKLGDSLVDGGNPFNYNAKFVESDNVDDVGDNWPATGYSIVKAKDMDEAVEMSKGCPGLQGGEEFSIRVYETMPM